MTVPKRRRAVYLAERIEAGVTCSQLLVALAELSLSRSVTTLGELMGIDQFRDMRRSAAPLQFQCRAKRFFRFRKLANGLTGIRSFVGGMKCTNFRRTPLATLTSGLLAAAPR
jgi:hypothetical protein